MSNGWSGLDAPTTSTKHVWEQTNKNQINKYIIVINKGGLVWVMRTSHQHCTSAPQQQQQPFGAPSRFTPAPQQHAFAPPMGGGGGGFRGPPPMQQQRPFAAPPGSSRCIVVLFCSLYIVSSTFSIFSTIWWRRPTVPQSTKGWLVSSRCQPLIHSHIYIKHK